jgi:hypothetical protein
MEKIKRIKRPPIVFDVEEVGSTVRIRIYSIDQRLIDSLGSDGFSHNCGGVIATPGFVVSLSDSKELNIEFSRTDLTINAHRGEMFKFPVECYLSEPRWLTFLKGEGDSITVILDSTERRMLAFRVRAALSQFNVTYRYPKLAFSDDEWES